MSTVINDPYNLGAIQVRHQRWAGLEIAIVTQHVLSGPAWHRLDVDRPLLSMVVGERGGRCETRLDLGKSSARRPQTQSGGCSGHASLIPVGVPVWGYSDAIKQVDELRLFLHPSELGEAMGSPFPSDALSQPRLMLHDPAILRLARLLMLEAKEGPGLSLFADSIVTAIVARLAKLCRQSEMLLPRAGLGARQLAAAMEKMRDSPRGAVRLADLAAFAGMSPAHFIRSFKAATGTTPGRWQLADRLDVAKRHLADPARRLVDIALDAGFAEQSQFNRAFKAATGQTPGQWRRRLAH